MNTHLATPLPTQEINLDGLNHARVAGSEWTKLRSLRSSGYALLAAVTMLIAFGIVEKAGHDSGLDGEAEVADGGLSP